MPKYEAVIGLECHAQLMTRSKLFCSCATRFGDPTNTNTCPVCLGHPGALPVLNRAAVGLAVKAAIALNCTVNTTSQWARKNYFYPDLPKGYQISQHDRPLAIGGHVDVALAGDSSMSKRIGVQRVHIEEDAGRTLDDGHLDFNRCGVPLIEIVSEPDIRSSAEAHDYLDRLKRTLEYLDVCDGNMEEGSLRCDANVSIRPVGSQELGTRTELKNINSFRFVRRAIDFEIQRQTEIVESGGRVVQETRFWNSAEQCTVVTRSKEDSPDYRYLPEPDLPLVSVDAETVKSVRLSLIELPEARRVRFMRDYGLSEDDARTLTSTRSRADYFEETAKLCDQPAKAANWMVNREEISQSRVTPRMLADMIALIVKGTLSNKLARIVLDEMYRTGLPPDQIVIGQGLVQIWDSREIEGIVKKVLAENAHVVADVRGGKTEALTFLVGLVMKASAGRANPEMVNSILRNELAG